MAPKHLSNETLGETRSKPVQFQFYFKALARVGQSKTHFKQHIQQHTFAYNEMNSHMYKFIERNVFIGTTTTTLHHTHVWYVGRAVECFGAFAACGFLVQRLPPDYPRMAIVMFEVCAVFVNKTFMCNYKRAAAVCVLKRKLFLFIA